ncbi:ATP-binding protein [Gynuella sunshinyii]|uniref:histidine kinase n=1 Tax=Gynuella sunshinyii YC6258 TaxID=1445510 RepID=A0A0C5VEU2_9GAMM|nr:sensor histidine kinase [Gynuella sunshinyii]AJQ97755.1 signal transduction histidine kinase regulating citrate/malate metabolism [Gynuella sunshinyii YC6258]
MLMVVSQRFKQLKLQSQMIIMLGATAFLQTGLIGGFTVLYLSSALEEQMGQRALYIAKTVAAMPEIIRAVEQQDSQTLVPVAQRVADETQAWFVVIGDKNGIRLAHPTPDRVGKSMLDDDQDDNAQALNYGHDMIVRADGSLGATMRGKTPIYDSSGENIIGIVSVGLLLNTVFDTVAAYRNTILAVITLSLLLSVTIAIMFARHFKQAILGLEPVEIAHLYKERDATLESIREGIIAIDINGKITTFNRAAMSTLQLDPDSRLLGQPISDVLPGSYMLEVLKTGIPQYDQEVRTGPLTLVVNRLPLLSAEGKVFGVVSSFRRKDELDFVSAQLTRIQQYAETLRSQAHEYSNKLHTIAGLIEIGAIEDALKLIGQETHDHQQLIQMLLENVPDPVIAGCILGKYNRARELGLIMEIDENSRMVDVPAAIPREKIVSILGNIIDNALEATLRTYGNGGKIALSMTDLGHDLVFEVEDQGPGLSDDQKQAIFEKGTSSKMEIGHGYGLHLVRQFVVQLHGTISIENAEIGGSRFCIYIPKHIQV